MSVTYTPKNNKLGWKRMVVENPLAYYDKAKITAVKSFIVTATGLFPVSICG
jgi:hypothetical protein